jgi:hypothetical protein
MPNLFHFATSELSQDALLCWLFSWSSIEYKSSKPALHEISNQILRVFAIETGISLPSEIKKIQIDRQYKNIDILIIIDDAFVFVIEDKTHTQQSKGQLEKYRKIIEMDFPNHKHGFIYLKTGDQSSYEAIKIENYTIIKRLDLLNILETPTGNSAANESEIFGDFRSHLREMENRIQMYRTESVDKWSWAAWTGFYVALQQQLGRGDWDYVANPTGGFMGYWADFEGVTDCDIYWQIEAIPNRTTKLCFKIGDVSDTSIRDTWHQKFMQTASNHTLDIVKPSRFGSGKYMTIAVYNKLNATLEILQSARNLIKSVVAEKYA